MYDCILSLPFCCPLADGAAFSLVDAAFALSVCVAFPLADAASVVFVFGGSFEEVLVATRGGIGLSQTGDTVDAMLLLDMVKSNLSPVAQTTNVLPPPHLLLPILPNCGLFQLATDGLYQHANSLLATRCRKSHPLLLDWSLTEIALDSSWSLACQEWMTIQIY